jgi:hypothetical protein
MISTRSFGRMKPPAEVAPRVSIEIATARMPAGRIADMKPEPSALMSFSRRIGSPPKKLLRAIEPVVSSRPFGNSVRLMTAFGALSAGQASQRRSAALRLWPIGRSTAATSTSTVLIEGGASTTCGTGAGSPPPIISAAAPPARIAMPRTARRAGFITGLDLNAIGVDRHANFTTSNYG